MTIDELIEKLEEAKSALGQHEGGLGGDAEVMLAHQPNWPLRFHIAGVAVLGQQRVCPDCEDRYLDETPDGWRCPGCGGEVEQDDLEESKDNQVCWLVEGGQPYDTPYAPRAVWDEEAMV